MTSKRDLLRALRNAEEDRDRAEQQALQCSGEMMHQKERADAARGRAQEILDQLRQLAESRSLEIRTEALRQARNEHGLVDLSLAYRIEQYLAKGVTLPTKTENLPEALSRARQAVAGLTELLDDSHSGRLNTILEALSWANRVSQENVELAAENERIRQINLEQSDMIRGANREISGLKREVHDQHNEIEEKTARIASLSAEWNELNHERNALVGDLAQLSRAKARIEQLSDHLGIPYIYESGLDTVPDCAAKDTADDEPVVTQYAPTAQEIKASVVSIVSRYVGSASLRGEVEAALAWVEEGDAQNRLNALSMSEGNFVKAKVIDALLSEE